MSVPSLSKETIAGVLRQVIDPELGINVVDLGLVESIEISDGTVHVRLGMTSPACPVGPQIRDEAALRLEQLPEVRRAHVELLRDFRWTPERISPEARVRLGMSTPAAPVQEAAAMGRLAVRRVPLLAAALLSLIVAVWAGLVRIGWPWTIPRPEWVALHGPLMVGGFLGTLISLERAVGMERPWAWAAPLLAVCGALSLLAPAPSVLAPVFLSGAALGLLVIYGAAMRTRVTTAGITQAIGAACWFVGNGLWYFQGDIQRVIPWWALFLILTIAGERLELSEALRPTKFSTRSFPVVIGLCLAGAVISLPGLHWGMRLEGIAWLTLALWFLIYDIARQTIRQQGLPKFAAASLLTGYFWLAFAGVLAFVLGSRRGEPYDAILHSLFLGFVFSMIFAHAPIIFPSVIRSPLPFRKRFYVHLVLLQISLITRLLGDLLSDYELRMAGALLSALAIALFLVNNVMAIRAGRRGTTLKAA